MSSLKRFFGELITDHRAGPGIPELGMPDGKEIRAPTITCWHCRTVFVVNPDRERPRNYCRSCDNYICDPCGIVAARPGYVHRSFDELADLVRSGRFTLHGSASDPILIPTLRGEF